MSTPLDRRLTRPGLTLTVAALVAVFVDHQPGQAATCGHCHHRYTATERLCPSMNLVRSLLRARRFEDPAAFEPIAKAFNARDTRHLPATPSADPDPGPECGELFAIDPTWVVEPDRGRWAA